MRKRILIVVGCFVVMGGLVTGLWAAKSMSPEQQQKDLAEETSVDEGFSLTEIVVQSDKIVIGKSKESRSQWVDRNLYTMITIEVSETLKGEAATTITLAVPGGIDANRKIPVAMTYPGAPAIQNDEEVFLFLTKSDELLPASFSVTGFNQGKFSITQDSNGNRLVARDASTVRAGGMRKLSAKSAGIDSLAEFKARVLSHIK